MVTLVEAFRKASKHVLTKSAPGDGNVVAAQKGGTCGLYSLWYASVLLKYVDPSDRRAPIYPRAYMGGGKGNSIRHYAKSIGSGQGEVLNWHEMFRIVDHCGYTCDTLDVADSVRRTTFIRFCLEKNRPILLAYLEGGEPGKSCHPARAYSATYPGGTGAHWALLVDDNGNDYGIIDPHWPNMIRYYPKDQVLASNAASDSGPSFPRFEDRPDTNKPQYDLGDTAKRQSLKNLLMSVY